MWICEDKLPEARTPGELSNRSTFFAGLFKLNQDRISVRCRCCAFDQVRCSVLFAPTSVLAPGNSKAMIARRTLTGAVLRLRQSGSYIGGADKALCSPSLKRFDCVENHRRRIHKQFSTTTATGSPETEEKVSITFVEVDGTERKVQGTLGKHLLDVAHENNIDLEGACGGELACSTCHLIFEQHIYDQLDPKEDDEDDMLDMALALTDT